MERITKSTTDYKQHILDIFNKLSFKYGYARADEFIKFYRSRYDKFNRSFIDYNLAFSLYDDYCEVSTSGVRWYAVVGDGGTGKTTLAKNAAYFLDNTFNVDSIHTEFKTLVTQLDSLPKKNAMKAIVLDEPDLDEHGNSASGLKIRDILGKARQQQLFLFFCATDLRDIRDFIYKKISGILFTKSKGSAMFFKNNRSKGIFIIQDIKHNYKEKGYHTFFQFQRSLGCLPVNTTQFTPLDTQDEERYQRNKLEDYDKTIKEYLALQNKERPSRNAVRDSQIIKMVSSGISLKEVAALYKIDTSTVSKVLERYDTSKKLLMNIITERRAL